MVGVAVATAMPAVGSTCPFVRARAGAVASQAWVNPYLGPAVLDALGAGAHPASALAAALADDPRAEERQVGVVDHLGRSFAHTGPGCRPYAGHLTGPDHAVQGNLLAGTEVLGAMRTAFLESAAEDLAERLLLALEAGEGAGGDRRGKQSAAILITGAEDHPFMDLRVDEHERPVTELRRVVDVARAELLPFLATLPTHADPGGINDPAVWELVERPPRHRRDRPLRATPRPQGP